MSAVRCRFILLGIMFSMCILYLIIEYIHLYPDGTLLRLSLYDISDETNAKNTSNVSISLKQFLKQYNISTLIKRLREIEASIYFEKIAMEHTDINPFYYTDRSPHYYDGKFNLSPGKTCKILRCAYHCTAHSIIAKAQFNEWTLRINQSRLNNETLHFLNILQSKYDIYTDLYKRFVGNIRDYRSPYIKPINLYFNGNSHMKQLLQGTVCLMEDIEINVFNNTYNKAVYSYYPTIETLNKSDSYNYDYNQTLCGDYAYPWTDNIKPWSHGANVCERSLDRNGMIISEKNRNFIMKQRMGSNIKNCESKSLYMQFQDKSRIFFRFNHWEKDKRMQTTIKSVNEFIKSNAAAFREFDDNASYLNEYVVRNLDLIVFNVGNYPKYNIEKHLFNDLKALNHFDKPIILLSTWWNCCGDELPFVFRNDELLNKLYEDYPNLIVLNLFRRNTKKLLRWNETLEPFHYDKYRWILAEGEPEGHMCQPGVPEHHILALTELINLLIEIYDL